MDALLLRAVIREIDRDTAGARVARVDQPGRYDVLLSIRKPGGACRVLVSADPQFPRMYTTSAAFDVPRQAPAFCMLLRKRLEGGRIEACEPVGVDRICMLRILSRDDLGNPARWTLVLEATGRNGNIILLDPESRVAATVRRSSRSASGGDISPGSVYAPPVLTTKINPAEVTLESLAGPPDQPCRDTVLKTVAGFGGVLAKEACFRAGGYEGLAAAVRRIWEESERAASGFVFLDPEGKPIEAHVVRLSSLGERAAVFESPSAALDYYYRRITGEKALLTARQALSKKLKALSTRTGRRLASRLDELDEARTGESHRKAGDLILTYMSQVAVSLGAHQRSVVLPDPETGEAVTVQIDPSLDAAANAQVHYRRYARMKARARLLGPLVDRDRDDLSYLESISEAVDRARDLDDLHEIEREMRDQGLLAREKGKPAPAAAASTVTHYARFVTSKGDEVLAGRNNRQNEFVTFRAAGRNDLWFHAKSVPGAHVVLRVQGAPAGEESLLEAATLAATLSRARSATKVEVDFCAVQHIRRRPGTRPGMVLYDKYETIVVRPDPDLVARLSR